MNQAAIPHPLNFACLLACFLLVLHLQFEAALREDFLIVENVLDKRVSPTCHAIVVPALESRSA